MTLLSLWLDCHKAGK